MVLKQLQVTPLYELSLQVISKDILNFIKEHYIACEFCSRFKTEECTAIKPVIEMLNLPENITQSVYKKVDSEYQFMITCDTKLWHLFSTLLRLDHTSLKINDFCYRKFREDMPFILKFGKNLSSLQFSCSRPRPKECADVNAFYRELFQSVNNIQVLDLQGVKVTAKLLSVVGQECTQLGDISNINVGERCVTFLSFKKLLFRDGVESHRNKCCDTLETIGIDTCVDGLSKKENNLKLKKILDLLLQNVTNLKSLGNFVTLDNYLHTLKKGDIRETMLHVINFDRPTKRTATMLKTFSPNANDLTVNILKPGIAQILSSFPCLQEIRVTSAEEYIVQEIVTAQWSNLKVLSVFSEPDSGEFFHLDLDLVARNLPVLTYLHTAISGVSWSRTKYFNTLERLEVSFDSTVSDISWFASFANTIKCIQVSCNENGILYPDGCQVLLTVPFPNLEILHMYSFPYNFLFYSGVISKLPKLENCYLYGIDEDIHERVQNISDLYQFMTTNNFQVDLHHRDFLHDYD